MAGSRQRHAAAFKAKVAMEAVRQTKTFGELARTDPSEAPRLQ
jgi:hypothetical protein